MDKPHPYLTAALLCEKVLEEKSGTMSLIRIADALTYSLVGMPQGYQPVVQFSGLVCLKSGPVTGDHVVKIVAENPVGERQELYSLPVKLMGKDHGQNLLLNLTLAIQHDGLHWFDVIFDDDVLTRIPLTVGQAAPPAQTEKRT